MYSLILKLAWKNSLVRVQRTLLVVIMIAVSMSLMLGLQGLYDGMIVDMVDKSKRSDSGNIAIYAKYYRVQRDIKYTINNSQEIKNRLKNNPKITAVTSRLKVDGLTSTARKSSFSSVIGIDLDEENRFGRFSEFVKSGEIKLDKKGCIVGLELAKKLKLHIGSKLIFSTQDISGDINSMALRVRATIQTTNIEIDNLGLYVDMKKLQDFLGTSPNQVTQIAIMSEDKTLHVELKNSYPNLDVMTFLELQPMLEMFKEMTHKFNQVTFFIIMGVVFIGIFGVMYVAILDRIREFGIVLSIGMQYKYIRFQIILESIFLGLFGYIVGVIFGLVLLIYLQEYGLNLSAYSDALEMWGYQSVIYGTIKLSYFTNTFFAIMSASILSVLIPLQKIKKLHPIDVIKADK